MPLQPDPLKNSSFVDDLISILFESYKVLTLFRFLGHVKFEIVFSLFGDDIWIVGESVELIHIFPDAGVIRAMFGAMIIQQIG